MKPQYNNSILLEVAVFHVVILAVVMEEVVFCKCNDNVILIAMPTGSFLQPAIIMR